MENTPHPPARLEKGKIVFYTLHPNDHPAIPEKLWAGRIVYMYHSFPAVLIESLEPGFEDDEETVFLCQIMSIL